MQCIYDKGFVVTMCAPTVQLIDRGHKAIMVVGKV